MKSNVIEKNEDQPQPKKYVLAQNPIPYFLNGLFLTNGVDCVGNKFDRSVYEFKYPKTLQQFFSIYGMEKNANSFNTSTIKKETRRIVEFHLQSGKPLKLLTIVCPPYAKKSIGARENIGLMTDINKDPIDFGFMYSYKIIGHTLHETAKFFESLGLSIEPVFIIGDWALRDNHKRKNGFIKNEKLARSQLDLFFQSAQKYFASHYPDIKIEVDRFQGTNIQGCLPFVMPQGPEEKKNLFSSEFSFSRLQGHTHTPDKQVLQVVWVLLKIYEFYHKNKDNLYQLAVQKDTWKSFVPPTSNRSFLIDSKKEVQEFYSLLADLDFDRTLNKDEYKRVWVRFFQIWSDTMKSRAQEKNEGKAGTHMDTIDAGFWDAMIKMYEYVIFSSTFKSKYPDSLMAYFDTKYPSAGMAFEEGGLDLLYLDTNNYWIPMHELRVKTNPF